jgi:trimethylamine:corrinoid methyltransferase-like protein
MDKRAGKVLESRLNYYEKPDIDPQLEQDLKHFVGRRKKSPDLS